MPLKNFLVSLAGGINSLMTAKFAIYFAKFHNAKLIGIYVIDEKAIFDLVKNKVFVDEEAENYKKDLEEQGKNFLERVKKVAQEKGIEFDYYILRGVVHEEVVKKIKELNIDLLIMGEIKEGLSRKDIFYDEGERILRDASCPVLVVKNFEQIDKLYKEL